MDYRPQLQADSNRLELQRQILFLLANEPAKQLIPAAGMHNQKRNPPAILLPRSSSPESQVHPRPSTHTSPKAQQALQHLHTTHTWRSPTHMTPPMTTQQQELEDLSEKILQSIFFLLEFTENMKPLAN